MTYSGPQKVILIGKESTWGTGVTTDKDVGVVQDITNSLNREVKEVMGLGAIETQAVHSGNEDHGGSMSVSLQHGRLFEYILGTVAHAETTGDWKHTFSVNNNPPSFTLQSGEDDSTDTDLVTVGCLVESAEMSINQTDPLMLKVDFKAKSTTSDASTGTASISSLVTFPKSLVTININSSAASEVQDAAITFGKRVERSYGVGSVVPQQGKGTELRFSYTAKLGFTDKTFQDLFINDTTHEFEIDADNGTSLGSGQRRIKCTLENCKNTKLEKIAAIGDLVFIDLAGTGTLKANETFSVDNIADTSW